MESILKIGSVNTAQENSIIYKEGQLLQSVALLLKGTVTMYNAGCRMVLGPGHFIGLQDLYAGKSSFTCEANEACSLYVFKASGLSDLSEIAGKNKEYKGYMIKSLNRILCNLNDEYYELKTSANEIYEQTKNIYETYQETVLGYGGEAKKVMNFQKLTEYNKNLPVKEEWVENIKEMLQIPNEVVGSYYSYLPNTALHEMSEKIKIVTILMEQLHQLVNYMDDVNSCLFNEGSDCIFKAICQEVMMLAPSHASYVALTDLVDKAVELVNQIESIYEECIGSTASINRAMMEKIYFAMLSDKDVSGVLKMDEVSNEGILKDLEGSLEQILTYGQIEPELSEHFRSRIETFYKIPDKYQVSDEMRVLRKEIAADFYAIYEKVFKVAYSTQEFSRVVEMFLNFGYVDERLLTKAQVVELYHFKLNYKTTHYCYCHTMFEWLTLIYEGKKEPSRNDLDMDYAAYIRHLKASGKVKAADEKQYFQDREKRLQFEITNMFALNMRLVNGKISTFVPVLFGDMLPLNMEKHFVTFTSVDEAVRDVVQKDFSLFYREVLYQNAGLGIVNELVMKEFLPDIIICPTCGTGGSMWQEMEGRRRESSGRFCVPIFHEANLYDTIVKLAARFRWELCRTLQGVSWNDIKNKCLTSEYCDYIQFYRKNKDLSEDKKEKVKQQMMKARNNTRECFVIDYEIWLQYESAGAQRLNKLARDILSMYCPFSKDIRKNLVTRPVFGESMFRYEKEVSNRARILEAKILSISKKGKDVPQELTNTVNFYQKK